MYLYNRSKQQTMNHKNYRVSEKELQNHMESLSERELKDFQLVDNCFEIARWKNRLIFSIINVFLFIVLAFRGYQEFSISIGIVGDVIAFGFIIFAIRSYNYMKAGILQHKMLEIFFEINNL